MGALCLHKHIPAYDGLVPLLYRFPLEQFGLVHLVVGGQGYIVGINIGDPVCRSDDGAGGYLKRK